VRIVSIGTGPRHGWIAIAVGAMLLFGCEQTNKDPRSGGFISGVSNLATGGYDSFVKDKEGELKTSQDRADTLEARARAISAERDALDRELQDVALDLERLQEKLAGLAARGEATRTRTAEERRKLKEAQARAKEAGNRLGTLRGDRTRSVAAQRQSIDDLKALIGNVAVMVNELSG